MNDPADFHVHLYFDPDQVDLAQAVASDVAEQFGAAIGHFHTRPVGPHPRGSVQLTVAPAASGRSHAGFRFTAAA